MFSTNLPLMMIATTASTILKIPENIRKPEKVLPHQKMPESRPVKMSHIPQRPFINAAIKKNIAAYLNISLASFIFGGRFGFELGIDSRSLLLISYHLTRFPAAVVLLRNRLGLLEVTGVVAVQVAVRVVVAVVVAVLAQRVPDLLRLHYLIFLSRPR